MIAAGFLYLWDLFYFKEGFFYQFPSETAVNVWAKEKGLSPDSAQYWQYYFTSAKVHNFISVTWRPVLAIVSLNALLYLLYSLFITKETHKIAGPIYHINQELDKILNNQKVGPIELRQKDEFQDLAKKLNHVLKDKIHSN